MNSNWKEVNEMVMTKQHMVVVRPSFVCPGINEGCCTIHIYEGSAKWSKVYTSEKDAVQEAREMGLIDQNNQDGKLGDQAQHPLLRAMAHEVPIDLEDMKRRGFHN
jgi:predicted Zn-dependent protease with MMP-like domain